jgi:tRNA pseudouridine55 synthase
MTVTSGFYVRSLCHDLGEKLGSGAMMAELVRTRQGIFVLGGTNCIEYEDLLRGEAVWGPKVESMLHLWNNPDAEPDKPVAKSESEPVSDAGVTAPAPAATSGAVDGEGTEQEAAPLAGSGPA